MNQPLRSPYILWTPERVEALKTACVTRDGMEAFARELHCPLVTVIRAAKRHHIQYARKAYTDQGHRPHARWTPELERELEAASQVDGGLSAFAAAKGLPLNTVSRHARRRGWQSVRGARLTKARRMHAEGVKECARCRETLPLDRFYFTGDKASPQSTYCRVCIQARKHETVPAVLRQTQAHKKGRVPVRFLLELFARQGGKCAYTGLHMTAGKTDTRVSVDRVDSDLPYDRRDNLVLCCYRVNIMKGVLPVAELRRWARAIAEHPGA